MNINLRSDRIGEIKYNYQNYIMEIVNYNNYTDIIVEFHDKFKAQIHTSYQCFKIGQVRNPYHKDVYGVGYTGQGNYKPSINGVDGHQYKTWNHMLERCYSKTFQQKQPSYIGCITNEEWHCFQDFGKWHDENYYEIDGEKMQLDKDILVKGNKIYSSKTCVFVPQRINSLFIQSISKRGQYPIGVSFHQRIGKYQAQINLDNKNRKSIGYYQTSDEAFLAYKIEKEKYIKEIADEYKSKIPKKLYDAMYKYKINIED